MSNPSYKLFSKYILDISNLDLQLKQNIVSIFPENKKYDVLVLAVAHNQFKKISWKPF